MFMLSLFLAIAQDKPVDKPVDKPAEKSPEGVQVRTEAALAGYTLIAPLNSSRVHLVDLAGEVRHTWKVQGRPGGAVYLEADGTLLRSMQVEPNPRFHGGGIGGRIEKLRWDGEVLWEYELAGPDLTLHHDFCRLPNGNLLAIAWECLSPDEARAKGRDPEYVHEEGLWSDVVLEIEPSEGGGGNIVWQWRVADHLLQDRDPKLAGYAKPADHPGRVDINADVRFLPRKESEEDRKKREAREREMKRLGYTGGDEPQSQKPKPSGPKIKADWLHTNAVSYLASEQLIALSIPHMGEIWVIDHATTQEEAATEQGGRRGKGGALLYRLGAPRNYGMGDKGAKTLFYQHHPTWIVDPSTAAVSLLLFNNGSGRPLKEYSSVEEHLLPFTSKDGFTREPGQPFGPAAPRWIYKDEARFFSAFISGAQRLSNGNTLICEGAKGRVFEVDVAGKIVWDYWSPHGGDLEPSEQGGKAPPRALFRAERIAFGDPRLAGRF